MKPSETQADLGGGLYEHHEESARTAALGKLRSSLETNRMPKRLQGLGAPCRKGTGHNAIPASGDKDALLQRCAACGWWYRP